jgi:hypothetical protein
MLAQNFKTADDLEITAEEHGALIKVLGMLERGELVDARNGAVCDNGFDMSDCGNGCGTAACIGGWVASILKFHQKKYVSHSIHVDGLYGLYFGGGCLAYVDATVSQAAIALRSYLTTGNARWDLALGGLDE